MMDFYVYIHRKATTGEVFYVGKGCGRRAWSTKNRSNYWHSVVNKYGLTVEIMQDGMQEWWAFELEQELIAFYGRRDLGLGCLANLSDGGEGSAGRIVSAEQRKRQSRIAMNLWADQEFSRKNKDRLRNIALKASEPVMCVELDLVFKSQRDAARYMQSKGVNIKSHYIAACVNDDRRGTCGGFTWAKIGGKKPHKKEYHVTAVVGHSLCFASQRTALSWLNSQGLRNTKSMNSGLLNDCLKGRKAKAYGCVWRYATAQEAAALKAKGASWAPLAELLTAD